MEADEVQEMQPSLAGDDQKSFQLPHGELKSE